jgi:large subunit ribosomal protein L29
MRPSEIRGLSIEELHRELDNRMKEYFNLRFQAATEQMENSSQVRKVKRDIARMKTILRERAAGEGKGAKETEKAQ